MQSGHTDDELETGRGHIEATPTPRSDTPAREKESASEPATRPADGARSEKTEGITQSDVLAMVRACEPNLAPAAKHPSRILCSELVEVSWRGIDGCLERTVANLEEIWVSGATLDLDCALPEGAALSIHRKADVLAGRLLYCQQNLTGYTAGVQFHENCRWSPERFVPDHAVEFGTLGRDAEALRPGSPEGPENRDQTSFADGEWTHPEESALSTQPTRRLDLDSLRPLIARGSILALRGQMLSK